MVWGSLHISSISLDAVGERYPAPRARRCPLAMIGPRGWKGKADQSLTRPDSAARRSQVGRPERDQTKPRLQRRGASLFHCGLPASRQVLAAARSSHKGEHNRRLAERDHLGSLGQSARTVETGSPDTSARPQKAQIDTRPSSHHCNSKSLQSKAGNLRQDCHNPPSERQSVTAGPGS